jgi:hypothetical protein
MLHLTTRKMKVGNSFRLISVSRVALLAALVAASVADLEAQTTRRVEEVSCRVANKNQFFDSVVEVFDPHAGVLLASRRVDSYLTQFVSNREAISFEESDAGTGKIIVWDLQFTRNSGRPHQ